MTRRLRLQIGSEQAGLRLDAVLGAWLPDALGRRLSKAALRKLIMAGAVRVGGRPLRRPGHAMVPGTVVEVAVALDRLPSRSEGSAAAAPPSVLYEDAALIVVDKPPGLPTHPTADPTRPHLVGVLSRWLAARDGGAPYLGVHQRLDRDTSGTVLFAKRPEANPGLARAFAAHEVVKLYHALTVRPPRLPPGEWEETRTLPGAGERGGPRPARTGFRRLDVFARGLLVEARPFTGRKHQIRIHLAAAGLPILGDATYGGTRPPAMAVPRTMLHAVALALRHPISGASLRVESPYPADFRRALARLGRRR